MWSVFGLELSKMSGLFLVDWRGKHLETDETTNSACFRLNSVL